MPIVHSYVLEKYDAALRAIRADSRTVGHRVNIAYEMLVVRRLEKENFTPEQWTEHSSLLNEVRSVRGQHPVREQYRYGQRTHGLLQGTRAKRWLCRFHALYKSILDIQTFTSA